MPMTMPKYRLREVQTTTGRRGLQRADSHGRARPAWRRWVRGPSLGCSVPRPYRGSPPQSLNLRGCDKRALPSQTPRLWPLRTAARHACRQRRGAETRDCRYRSPKNGPGRHRERPRAARPRSAHRRGGTPQKSVPGARPGRRAGEGREIQRGRSRPGRTPARPPPASISSLFLSSRTAQRSPVFGAYLTHSPSAARRHGGRQVGATRGRYNGYNGYTKCDPATHQHTLTSNSITYLVNLNSQTCTVPRVAPRRAPEGAISFAPNRAGWRSDCAADEAPPALNTITNMIA